MTDPQTWDALTACLPDPQLLQTWEWGQVKLENGWTPEYQTWRKEAAALILKRTIPIRGLGARMGVMYVPRGPMLDYSNPSLRREVLHDLAATARKRGAIFIKIDPFVPLGMGIPGTETARDHPPGLALVEDLRQNGWVPSPEQIQFRNTVMIDLSLPEETLLANMKQKTRYNIRLAEKKGVQVRAGSPADLGLIYKMYAETSVRDRFVIRNEDYYRRAWGLFLRRGATGDHSQPSAEVLIAEVEGEPAAAVVVYRFGQTGWYMFGMSRQAHREKMPNHLLQWEAMRRLKSAGCTRYDLWGAPDRFDERDPMWGVYRFKEGLGGTVVRTSGAWDMPARPLLYKLYTQTLPKILDQMRKRGRTATKRVAGDS